MGKVNCKGTSLAANFSIGHPNWILIPIAAAPKPICYDSDLDYRIKSHLSVFNKESVENLSPVPLLSAILMVVNKTLPWSPLEFMLPSKNVANYPLR
jgi:hypothetical protein